MHLLAVSTSKMNRRAQDTTMDVDYGYETCVPDNNHDHGSKSSITNGDESIRLICLQAASSQQQATATNCDFIMTDDSSHRHNSSYDDPKQQEVDLYGYGNFGVPDSATNDEKKKKKKESEIDYGYGDMSESAPDSDNMYGYETAEPTQPPRQVSPVDTHDDDDDEPKQQVVDYGYGDCVPDSAINNKEQQQQTKKKEQKEEIDNYGYGDVSESAPDSDMYGYETAAPTPRRRFSPHQQKESNPYGYGDGAPDSAGNVDYGYGDGAPDSAAAAGGDVAARTRSPDSVHQYQQGVRHNSYQNGRRVPRRSSMKQAGRVGRRSSIGYTGEVVLNLPGRKEPVRRRTSISFDNYEEVAEVEPIKDLAEDSKQLWFQQEEYDMIREKALLITSIASSMGGEDPNGKLCTRGLEPHIYRDQVAQEQFIAKRSVLVEQEHQRNMGIYDDEIVSKIYQLTSMSSTARANVFAQKDYAVAESHTRNERIQMRRSSIC